MISSDAVSFHEVTPRSPVSLPLCLAGMPLQNQRSAPLERSQIAGEVTVENLHQPPRNRKEWEVGWKKCGLPSILGNRSIAFNALMHASGPSLKIGCRVGSERNLGVGAGLSVCGLGFENAIGWSN